MFDTFDRTGNAEFPFHKKVVFRAVCESVQRIRGMDITNQDDLASRLDVKTGASAFSWGEKVSITVTGNGEESAVVSIQSGVKTVLGSATAHGKNRENVKQIINRTSELLGEYGSAWAKEMGLNALPVRSTSTEKLLHSIADEITKLAELRDRGILSDDEFNTQKARVLGG